MTILVIGITIITITGLSQYILRSSVNKQGRSKYLRIGISYFFYFSVIIMNVKFLQQADLKLMSVVLSIGYVVAYGIGVILFKESSYKEKNLGIVFIFIGSAIFLS